MSQRTRPPRSAPNRTQAPGPHRVTSDFSQSEHVELTIERVLPGGLGIGYADGRTVLVGLAAPGDRLRVRLGGRRGKAWFGTIETVLEPSDDRVAPACPYFGECGGCDFQQLEYQAQLRAKVEAIRDCLRRIAGIPYDAEIPIAASPNQWHYRASVEWQIDPASGAVGYFARDSHRVVDIAACPIADPALNEVLVEVRESSAINPPSARTEVRAVAGDGAIGLGEPGDAEVQALSRTVGGHVLGYDPRVFFQANPGILEPLVQEVLWATREPGDWTPHGAALDLYCGIGLFTLPLAARYARVIGVESDARTAEYAESNAREAGYQNVRIRTATVETWLPPNAAHLGRIALVVLDPPRTGAEAAMPAILKVAPNRIAYVSCDPATLARDIKILVAGGYLLERVAAFDMFPQTHHVEIVAHLRRPREGRSDSAA